MRIRTVTGRSRREYGGYKIDEGTISIHKNPNVISEGTREAGEWVFIRIRPGTENQDEGFLSMSPELARTFAIGILCALEDVENPVEIRFKDQKPLR